MKLLVLILFTISFQLIANAQWSQIGLDIEGEAANDNFGVATAINSDGTIVAIGAGGNDGNGSSAGHVRVFEDVGGNWQQIGNDIEGEQAGDLFGRALSLSADGLTLAASSTLATGIAGPYTGQVRVFNFIGGNWMQLGSTIEGINSNDFYGADVQLSDDGTILAISSSSYSNSGVNAGLVQVFKLVSGNWVQIGSDIEGESALDYMGVSIDLSADGNVIAIGSHGNDAGGTNAGSVRVFENLMGVWTQVGGSILGSTAGDGSGSALSLNDTGTILAIGADNNDVAGYNAGQVRIFEFNGANWIQSGTDLLGEASENYFGNPVSLNGSGNRIAVGATYNSTNGTEAGQIKVFENINSSWIQIGQSIYGEAAQDYFGEAIDFNEDGSKLVGGSGNNNGNGIESGHARVYEFCSNIDLSTSLNGITIAVNQTGASYQWLDCDNSYASIVNETDSSFTASLNGNYACEITLGCSVDTTSCITISEVGLNVQDLISLDIYPNPSNGTFKIEFPFKYGLNLTIFNGQGQIIYKTGEYICGDLIDLSKFDSGLYLAEVIHKGNIYHSRIILNE